MDYLAGYKDELTPMEFGALTRGKMGVGGILSQLELPIRDLQTRARIKEQANIDLTEQLKEKTRELEGTKLYAETAREQYEEMKKYTDELTSQLGLPAHAAQPIVYDLPQAPPTTSKATPIAEVHIPVDEAPTAALVTPKAYQQLPLEERMRVNIEAYNAERIENEERRRHPPHTDLPVSPVSPPRSPSPLFEDAVETLPESPVKPQAKPKRSASLSSILHRGGKKTPVKPEPPKKPVVKKP